MKDREEARSAGLHGVSRQADVDHKLDAQVEELQNVGFTSMESGLSASGLVDLRERMESVYDTQLREFGGVEGLAHCNDLDVARCPLAYDDTFVSVAANRPLMELVQRILGENFVLLQQNALFNRPGAAHYQTNWHRDLSYQHWVSSEPLAINALLAIDDFTTENGATCVLPSSQHRAECPSDGYIERFGRSIEVPAGTFLVLDAMLFHRAGRNRSTQQRRGVNHVIGRPFLGQQFDLPRMVDARHQQDVFLNKYLGFRWAPCDSVTQWRSKRSP